MELGPVYKQHRFVQYIQSCDPAPSLHPLKNNIEDLRPQIFFFLGSSHIMFPRSTNNVY